MTDANLSAGSKTSELLKCHFIKTPETKDSKTIYVKTEPDWFDPSNSIQDEQVMETSSAIVKSEYEFQSSSANCAIKYEDETDDDHYVDNADDYYLNNDNDDCFLKEHNEDQDDDSAFVPKKTTTERTSTTNSRHIEQYHNFHEKRKILDAYMLRACPYCGVEFEFLADWNTHLDDVHNHSSIEKTQFTHIGNRRARCNECNTVIVYKIDAIMSHVFLHLPHRNIYKCKLCPLAKFRQFAMLQHIETRHFDVVGEALSVLRGENSTLCPYCDKYVGVLMMIAIHIQKEHSDIYERKLWYVCPMCDEKFAEEKLQKEHLKAVHQFHTYEGLCFEKIDSKKFRCLKCNAQIMAARFSQLPLHALTHFPFKCFKCRYCDYTHDKRWKVIKHSCEGLQLDIKNNPNLTAKTSAPKFRGKRSKWDGNNKLFVCPKCGQDFEEQSLWEVHMIKEHNFNDIEYLNLEKTTTSDGESVISCKVCDRKFDQKNRILNLRRHAFIHMAYRIYKCQICKKPLESMTVCSCQDTNGSSSSILHVCPKCGKECNSQGNWKRHMSKAHKMLQPSSLGFVKSTTKEFDDTVTSYKCSECGEVIMEHESLCRELMFKHAAIEHMPFKCYKCSKCGMTSASKDIMLEHARNCKMELDLDFYKDEAECKRIAKCQCHVCGAMADSEDIIGNHLKDIHQLKMFDKHIFTWICTECKFKFDTKEESFKHVLSLHLQRTSTKNQIDLLSYSCPVCNMKFEKKADWDEHIFEQHALNTDEGRKMQDLGESFKCLECNKVFEKKLSNKRNHCLEHLPFSAFECLSCGLEFKKIHTAQKHVQKCSITMKSKQCKKRKLSAAQNKLAKKRKREPTLLKKSKMESVCPASSVPLPIDSNKEQTISSLTSMAKSSPKTHVWNKYCNYMTYACPECNTACETSESWHEHISQYHNFFAEEQLHMSKIEDRVRKCNECNVIISGGVLHAQRHKLTHMPYKAFICKICNHRSRTNNVLIQHIERRHLKAGTFKCSICAAVLSSTLEREEHIKTEHADAKNVCEICIKIFCSKKSLRLHMGTHDVNRERFECGFCERSYYQKSERRIHWIRWHPVEFAKMETDTRKFEETLKQEILKGNKCKAKKERKPKKKIAPQSEDDLDSDAICDFEALAGPKPSARTARIKTGGQSMKIEKPVLNAVEEVKMKTEPESNDESELESISIKEELFF